MDLFAISSAIAKPKVTHATNQIGHSRRTLKFLDNLFKTGDYQKLEID